MVSMIDSMGFSTEAALSAAARIAVASSLRLREGETLLIVCNPDREVLEIACAVFDAASAEGAKPSLVVQGTKGMADFAEAAVIAAFKSRPAAFVSLSTEKLGKDEEAMRSPYERNGVKYDHIFHYQLRGEKSLRAVWSPGITREMFARTLPIDYSELAANCRAVAAALDGAIYARITSELGTDIRVGLEGRAPKLDDGDFSTPGSGGNLPAGEVFVSPRLGSSEGTIVFDGSIAAMKGTMLIREPIRCRVEGGFVVEVSGGEEAAALRKTLESASADARLPGRLPPDQAEAYARNARSLGELGIGLNPAARVTGNMLEDEKAFRTCHFAIGSNYDEDAPALIHLDGLVSRPTIVAVRADGSEVAIEREGELLLYSGFH